MFPPLEVPFELPGAVTDATDAMAAQVQDLGPYSRTMPRALWKSLGEAVSYERSTPTVRSTLRVISRSSCRGL